MMSSSANRRSRTNANGLDIVTEAEGAATSHRDGTSENHNTIHASPANPTMKNGNGQTIGGFPTTGRLMTPPVA